VSGGRVVRLGRLCAVLHRTVERAPPQCNPRVSLIPRGVRRVPVLHTFVDGIHSFVELLSCQPLFGGWQDLELAYVKACIPRIVVWLSWIMWAISCSRMQKVLWVRGCMPFVCPNQAYTHDCCAPEPRPSRNLSHHEALSASRVVWECSPNRAVNSVQG
jgi:hypothetical protein